VKVKRRTVGFDSQSGKGFFSSAKSLDLVRSPPSLLSNGHLENLPGTKRAGA
jgi:hypothetical protein